MAAVLQAVRRPRGRRSGRRSAWQASVRPGKARRPERTPRRQNPGRPNAGNAPPAKPSLGLIPLSDMTATDRYKEQDGGLYGQGKNSPPEAHLQAALREAGKIVPRDAKGEPSPDGKIVMISNGMSNTTQEFSRFVELANADPEKSPQVQIVDCAQGGQEAFDWAKPDERGRNDRASERFYEAHIKIRGFEASAEYAAVRNIEQSH